MNRSGVIITTYSTHAAVSVKSMFGHEAAVIRKFLRIKLTSSRFDKRYKRFVPDREYHAYDKDTKSLLIPINFVDALKAALFEHSHIVEMVQGENVVARDIELAMQPQWVDREAQKGAIEYLLDPNGGHVRTIGLQTGVGKTYVSQRTITTRKKVAMIVTAGLVDQWREAILAQTDIDPEDIFILQGYKSFVTLLNNPDIQPKIFIASLASIRPFINKKGAYIDFPMSYKEFISMYGIGIKVNDECHTHFHFIAQMDLRSNIEHNIYLSATYTRADKSTLAIFDVIFPAKYRYGELDYNRYVDIHFYIYRMDFRDKDAMGYHGYSHIKYEDILIHTNPTVRDQFLDLMIHPLIRSHYLKIKSPKQKLLILVKKIKTVKVFVEQLEAQYPDLVIKPYTAEDPDENYADGVDIIVSTPTSAGTGRDIPNLRTTICTVSTQSIALIKQMLGRLRKLPNGDTPVYIDMCNAGLPSHVRHYKNRTMVLRPLGLTYQDHKLF